MTWTVFFNYYCGSFFKFILYFFLFLIYSWTRKSISFTLTIWMRIEASQLFPSNLCWVLFFFSFSLSVSVVCVCVWWSFLLNVGTLKRPWSTSASIESSSSLQPMFSFFPSSFIWIFFLPSVCVCVLYVNHVIQRFTHLQG